MTPSRGCGPSLAGCLYGFELRQPSQHITHPGSNSVCLLVKGLIVSRDFTERLGLEDPAYRSSPCRAKREPGPACGSAEWLTLTKPRWPVVRDTNGDVKRSWAGKSKPLMGAKRRVSAIPEAKTMINEANSLTGEPYLWGRRPLGLGRPGRSPASRRVAGASSWEGAPEITA